MGQWNISIQGYGIHDNGRDDDADAMLRKFVSELQLHHEVESVYFTVGASRSILDKVGR